MESEPTNRTRLHEESWVLIGERTIFRVSVVFAKWYAIDRTPYRAVLPRYIR